MKIDVGTEYKITESVRRNFNSAEALTVIRQTNNTIQFTLNGKNGYGAMPLQHMQYLLKKNYITQSSGTKRQFLSRENKEEQIV
ncbi:hypothetical protein DS745_24140 [Anaerobacillus alkaliphilus]|uniref:Uncharacterized protein n=1 Tax=Anaerobacillus alkaliphilus TaxID=1548597 RepID=A0A4Q0VLJ0_9BACI|nr:hypothetical protein [Anaerobacillus alkaliphilus]RXI95546.1 hypothetical protein DS745_24140 [Anaerobacillus alkaliphilus]